MTNAADTHESAPNDAERDESLDTRAVETGASKLDAATNDAATNDAATNDAATNDAATNDAAMIDAATTGVVESAAETTDAETTESAKIRMVKPESVMGEAAETEKSGTTPGESAQSSPGSTVPRDVVEHREPGGPWWRSVRAVAVLAALALVAAVTFGVLWATDDSAAQLSALQARLDAEAAAETAASEYALRVSAVGFGDLDAWRKALTDGVSQQLAPKLEAAVDVVGPWLSQMEYTATARLLAADVSETDGDRFVVQVFVDMTSKSKQTPDGVAATATYTVTMDRASNWTITDVGGVGGGLPGAGATGTGDR